MTFDQISTVLPTLKERKSSQDDNTKFSQPYNSPNTGKQLLSNSSVLNTDISYTPNIKIPTVIEFTTNKRKKTIKPLTTQPLAKNKTVMFKYHDGNSWYSAKLISRGRFLLVNMQMHATFKYKMMMSIKGIGFDRDV